MTRRCLLLLLVPVVVTACPTRTAGQDAQVENRGPVSPGPAQSLVASAVYPGLGQLLNESEHKAALIGGAEAFLIARLVLEDRWTRHAYRRYQETGQGRYFDEYSRHFDTRQTLIWWAIVAALYGMADAYVDAHLMGFDDMRPASLDGWSDVPGGDEDAIRIGFAYRF